MPDDLAFFCVSVPRAGVFTRHRQVLIVEGEWIVDMNSTVAASLGAGRPAQGEEGDPGGLAVQGGGAGIPENDRGARAGAPQGT